uniref:Uncharacterized protein n=1 Tax=Lepeophtheirus salmonis TaxID=72036 RepID=A0A0K2TZB0_LEPSM
MSTINKYLYDALTVLSLTLVTVDGIRFKFLRCLIKYIHVLKQCD